MVEIAISAIHLSWMWVPGLAFHSFSHITVSQQSLFAADRGAVLLPQVFNLGFSGSMAILFLSIQASQKFGGFFALSHSPLLCL